MTQPQRERVRRVLLDRLATGAAKRRSFGWLARLSRWLLFSPDATYVFEHSACDMGRKHCTGEVQGAWVINREGVRSVDMSPDVVSRELRDMWYRFNQVHFYIAPAGNWVVQTSIDGPRVGKGGCYRVVPNESDLEFVPEGPSWRA